MAESTCLENRRPFAGSVGSNPTSSENREAFGLPFFLEKMRVSFFGREAQPIELPLSCASSFDFLNIAESPSFVEKRLFGSIKTEDKEKIFSCRHPVRL